MNEIINIPNLNININSRNKSKSIDEIIEILSNEFQQKPIECDLLISLFYTTLYNRKSYILTNPFPPSFIDPSKPISTQKNFDLLRQQFSSLPNVNLLSNKHILESLSNQTLQALHFIIKSSDGISVKFIDYKKFEKKHGFLKDSPDHLKSSHKPSIVFKIKYNINSDDSGGSSSYYDKRYKKFKELSKSRGKMLGYHGSGNENWFNIIKGRGFSHQFVSEECIFGKGFYFSSDSKVSTSFIKWGGNVKGANKDNNHNNNVSELWWPNSMWSKKKIGFLSACTLINTPDTARGNEVYASNHHISPHVYTEKDRSLPPTYILADNPEDIRVKYMLLFSEDHHSSGSSSNNGLKSNKNNIIEKGSTTTTTTTATTTTTTTNIIMDKNISNNNVQNEGIIVKLKPLFRFIVIVIVIFVAHFILNTIKTSNKKVSVSHKGVFY